MSLFAGLMIMILFFGKVDQKRIRLNSGIRNENRSSKMYCFFALFSLWFLLAFRAEHIGSDSTVYVRIFDNAVKWAKEYSEKDAFFQELFVNETRYETGYIVLNRLVALVTDNHQWLFIMTSSFCVIICWQLIKKHSADIPLSIFLLISLRHYYIFFSGIRQVIAMMICVVAFEQVKKRRFFSFVFFVLLASQFHITALIFLAVYPMSYLRFNFKGIFVVSITMIITLFAFENLLANVLSRLPDYYEHYTKTERFDVGNVGNIIMSIIQLLFVTMGYFSRYNKNKIGKLILKRYDESNTISYMMLFSFWLAVISLKATTLDRLYWYTWLFGVIYAPNVLVSMSEKNQKRIFMCLLVFFTFTYNIVLLRYRPEWNSITPYQFFWQEG